MGGLEITPQQLVELKAKAWDMLMTSTLRDDDAIREAWAWLEEQKKKPVE